MDAWNTARDAGFGMSYFNRTDLPYYYALADAFTIGDAYFMSTFTATNPNRLMQFSGSNGLSVQNVHYPEDAEKYNQLDDGEPNPGFPWETVGEVLEREGISWKVYMEDGEVVFKEVLEREGISWKVYMEEECGGVRVHHHLLPDGSFLNRQGGGGGGLVGTILFVVQGLYGEPPYKTNGWCIIHPGNCMTAQCTFAP